MGKAHVIALALVEAGCGLRPAPVPRPPGATPIVAEAPVETPAPPSAQTVLVGEMCPDGAGGRPALAPLAARRPRAWTAGANDVGRLASDRARRWSVVGWKGRKVGTFTAVGPLDSGTRWPIVLGGYGGGSPCGEDDDPERPECMASQRGCGLAFASVDEERDLPPPGGACVEAGKLVLDVDGHGDVEAFPLADLAAEAEELVGAPARATCAPRFAARAIAPGVDLVGVLDLDGDGRREVLVKIAHGEASTWLVYTPIESAARLTRAAVAIPWKK